MIKHEKYTIVTDIVDHIVCDKCGEKVDDDMEMQEMHHVNFVGGYSSVFGDMNKVRCDLCQHCLYDLIGEFCIVNGE